MYSSRTQNSEDEISLELSPFKEWNDEKIVKFFVLTIVYNYYQIALYYRYTKEWHHNNQK